VLHGYGQTASTMPPPEQWGGLISVAQARAFNNSLPQYSYNLAKAKAERCAVVMVRGVKGQRSSSSSGKSRHLVYPRERHDRA